MRFAFSIHPYSALMIIAALVSLLVGAKAWYGTRKELARSFALMQAEVFAWSAFALAQWESSAASDQVLALKLQYLGIALLPATVYAFARTVAKRGLKPLGTISIHVPGLVFFALVETNELHHAFWSDERLQSLPVMPIVAWGFWVFALYSYAQIAVALFELLRAAARAKGLIARRMRNVVGLLSLPFAANILFVAFLIGDLPADPTPIVFAFSSLMLSVLFDRFNFLDVVPYAKGVLLDTLKEPFLIVDAEGIVVAAMDKTGGLASRPEELEGRLAVSVVPGLAGLVADDEPKVVSEGGIDYLVTRHGIRRGRKRRQGSIFLFRDISPMVRVTKELEEARAKADAANSAKSAFIATVSHELRNPLNAIIGLAELDLRAGAPPEMRDDLEMILSSGNVLLGLVNDLLDFSKIEAGKMELESIAFDLHEKAVSVLRAFRPAAEKKNLLLDIVIEEGTPRYVKGDPLRYGQILMNFVSNAVKFTERGAVIVVISPYEPTAAPEEEAAASDDSRSLRVLTAVRDTGMGIASDKMHLLFREFFQADPSVGRRFGGTGLGLSICKRLVDLFGGEIWVESAEGKGSVFSFTTRFEAAEAVAKTPPGRTVKAEVRRLRILVVDDDPINAAVARRYIERFGHAAVVAGTGAAALELAMSEDLDLVLLDLGLPDMDGLEVCRRIRADTATRPGGEPPIAAMTARVEPGLRAAGASAGMIDCLSKPIDAPALERLLDRLAAKAGELGPRAASSVRASQPAVAPSAAPPQPTRPGTPLIDLPALLERLDGDGAFMRELLGIFVEEAPARLSSFEKAAEARDIELLQKLGHALKGSSLSLCAKPLGAEAGALESACVSAMRNGHFEPEARIGDLVALLGATAEAAESIIARGA